MAISTSLETNTEKWEQLLTTPGFRLEDQEMISLTNNTLLDVPFNHPKYADLQKATIKTFEESISQSLENVCKPVLLPYIYEIQTMLIATKSGVLFGIHKGVDTQQRLKDYNQLVNEMCVDNLPWITSKFPNRKPYQSNILVLPNFQNDLTHLRMTRFIGCFENYELFLEKNTGTIRKIHHVISDRDATQVFSPFHEPPEYVKLYLHKRETMTPLEIYEKAIRISKSKKIRIQEFKKERDLKYTAIIDEVPNIGDLWNLNGSDSDSSDD